MKKGVLVLIGSCFIFSALFMTNGKALGSENWSVAAEAQMETYDDLGEVGFGESAPVPETEEMEFPEDVEKTEESDDEAPLQGDEGDWGDEW